MNEYTGLVLSLVGGTQCSRSVKMPRNVCTSHKRLGEMLLRRPPSAGLLLEDLDSVAVLNNVLWSQLNPQ